MGKRILEHLEKIEKDNNIEILLAVESGSRAWGFASPDSDYDIRFVYKHKTAWYLNLWEQKDTIEFMTEDDLDGVGWDIRKALRLLSKSNASFTGWLFSPVVYKSDAVFLKEIKQLANDNFNPVAGFYHFHSMNKGFEETLGTESMTLKSFFYTIRTALCVNWIVKKNTIPPVCFKYLYELVDENFHGKIDELIQLKSKRIEKSTENVAEELIDLVRVIIAENNSLKSSLTNKKSNPNKFNAFFLKYI
ncbi:nucleotidyltransferase domain-containing protein [Tenacibaculum sp. Bg11-29]|uniref:nucleotidyltransferase domain-containing protein n=1 Tax=Tenacibaculum sp. Bg11-29 TaxID=2058306 RepID=UPI000C32C9A2|nr:nucleotidyltransferase domain-containing protein [Tenacibaculum sp. Bg11-29]PKH52199.1 nucleotidyltransferase domain-containing protein [Tenacibaculum sp. Bg11-29]